MFAKGSVAVFKSTLVLNLKVKLIDFAGESILVHVDQGGTNLCGVELLETERVHYDFARDL